MELNLYYYYFMNFLRMTKPGIYRTRTLTASPTFWNCSRGMMVLPLPALCVLHYHRLVIVFLVFSVQSIISSYWLRSPFYYFLVSLFCYFHLQFFFHQSLSTLSVLRFLNILHFFWLLFPVLHLLLPSHQIPPGHWLRYSSKYFLVSPSRFSPPTSFSSSYHLPSLPKYPSLSLTTFFCSSSSASSLSLQIPLGYWLRYLTYYFLVSILLFSPSSFSLLSWHISRPYVP